MFVQPTEPLTHAACPHSVPTRLLLLPPPQATSASLRGLFHIDPLTNLGTRSYPATVGHGCSGSGLERPGPGLSLRWEFNEIIQAQSK